MSRASRGFDRMRKSSKKMGSQLRSVGQGLKSVGLAAAPATAAFGFAAKTAADFEAQMSVVQSVILGTSEEMSTLSAAAKEMGATTVFTAKQASEGQEFLARAGLKVNQIVAALPGVLNAAAASGVDLATATDIVVSSLGAFGLEAEKAGEVADAMSLTTALTNTNFTQLGEAMKFASPAAKQAGLSMQETAVAIGVMANAGVKGSLAGTALKNSLAKLAKPSKKAIDLFGGRAGMDKALFRIVDGQKKLKPLEVIMANIQKVVAKSADPLQATAKAFEILGLRGATSFSSFSASIGKTTEVTKKNVDRLNRGFESLGEKTRVSIGDSLPSLVALRVQVQGATGTAAEMAKIRLDNLKGQFVLLQSATSGVAIELGSLITGPLKRGVQTMTIFVSASALAFQSIISGTKISKDKIAAADKALAKFGLTFNDIQEFAAGFVEGFKEVKQAAFETFNSISEFLKPILGDTGLTIKEFGKLAAKVITIGAIVAPIILGIGAAIFILGPIISGIIGFFGFLGSVIGVVFGAIQVIAGLIGAVLGAISLPVLAVIAAIVAVGAVIFIFRDEIFSAFQAIGNFLLDAFQPVITIFKFIGALATVIFNEIAEVAGVWATTIDTNVIQPIGNFFGEMWEGVASTAKSIFQSILDFVIPIGTAIGNVFLGVGKFIFDALTFPIRAVFSLIKGVISKIADSAIGRKALSLAGVDAASLNSSLASLPGVDSIDAATGVKASAGALGVASTEGKVLAQAPTADENASAIASATAGASGGGQSSGGSSTMKVVVEGRIRGKDLVLVQTREQISQTEMNGQQIDPAAKQKMLRNGAPMGGFN